MFTTDFEPYAVPGDTIVCNVGVFHCVASLHADDDTTPPDQRDDGFWPSKNPSDAGYVLPENYEVEMAKAARVMQAWKNDEWHYVGVEVRVYCHGVCLTRDYEHAVWGIECNWPGSNNSHLRTVANDLLPEALAQAKLKLAALVSTAEEPWLVVAV